MLSAVLLQGEQLASFHLASGTAAFCVEGVSFAGKDIIVEMENSIYRGDMYRFSARARID
jgi:GntR family transcriptional regulator